MGTAHGGRAEAGRGIASPGKCKGSGDFPFLAKGSHDRLPGKNGGTPVQILHFSQGHGVWQNKSFSPMPGLVGPMPTEPCSLLMQQFEFNPKGGSLAGKGVSPVAKS